MKEPKQQTSIHHSSRNLPLNGKKARYQEGLAVINFKLTTKNCSLHANTLTCKKIWVLDHFGNSFMVPEDAQQKEQPLLQRPTSEAPAARCRWWIQSSQRWIQLWQTESWREGLLWKAVAVLVSPRSHSCWTWSHNLIPAWKVWVTAPGVPPKKLPVLFHWLWLLMTGPWINPGYNQYLVTKQHVLMDWEWCDSHKALSGWQTVTISWTATPSCQNQQRPSKGSA